MLEIYTKISGQRRNSHVLSHLDPPVPQAKTVSRKNAHLGPDGEL
jgi:hypothetical protein